MAHVDPARAPKRTKREIVENLREQCRLERCGRAAAKSPGCPFCPYWNEILREIDKNIDKEIK